MDDKLVMENVDCSKAPKWTGPENAKNIQSSRQSVGAVVSGQLLINRIEQRSIFRPTPEIFVSENGKARQSICVPKHVITGLADMDDVLRPSRECVYEVTASARKSSRLLMPFVLQPDLRTSLANLIGDEE